MRAILLLVGVTLTVSAQIKAPKIWDDTALEDWATPIAALGVRPGHYTAAEYYAVPEDNLRTYPVYRPDKEPPGYWEWLQKQKPQPLVDASELRTRAEWIKAGETAFRTMDHVDTRTSDPQLIRAARDPKSFEGIWTQADGSLLMQRWVVAKEGVQLSLVACGGGGCHLRADNDRAFWGAPDINPPSRYRPRTVPSRIVRDSAAFLYRGDSVAKEIWRRFTVPWAPDERIERVKQMSDADASVVNRPERPMVVARDHGSPFYATKVPDLSILRYSQYIDATATHKLRGPEDVSRYAALIMGADPMEFGRYHILRPEQRRVPYRYADEVLYVIGVYLMSLEPPKNPDVAPPALVARGGEIFSRETCVSCHVPPNYTSGKLTLAQGFTPPADHTDSANILNVSVATDPGLALKTRKGTGFYKIPSLRGVWYRPLLLHDGSVASLEEMFDPDRLKPDHVPGGWKGPGVNKRAIPGHPFGLALNAEDKKALLAFLRSL